MGTIIINGKRFVGNNITIRNGKVVIDGKAQDGEMKGVVEAQVVEGVFGRAECDASVTYGEVRGGVAVCGSATCKNVGGSIQAAAFASADKGLRKWKKR